MKWTVIIVIGIVVVRYLGSMALSESEAHSYEDSALCTGSMNPAITCFDIITFTDISSPEDILVGTVIETPDCDEPNADYSIVHRVLEVRVKGDVTGYRTRGDNNTDADSCWTPFGNVISYVSNVEKRYPEKGMKLLHEIWAVDDAGKILDAAIRDREHAMHNFAVNGQYYEHDALIPQYNLWAQSYNEKILDKRVLRARLQSLKDGMREYQ